LCLLAVHNNLAEKTLTTSHLQPLTELQGIFGSFIDYLDVLH
jgi:hypothetical protein